MKSSFASLTVLLVLLQLLFANALVGQENTVQGQENTVQIKGYAPNYIGKEMQLITYGDYLSNLEIRVVSETVNDSGLFYINFETDKIKRVMLRCGKQHGALYVQPHSNYRVFFPARDTVRFINPETDQRLDLTIGSQDTLDINNLVLDFNAKFDTFWTENYQYFVVKRAHYKLDTFGIQMAEHYAPLRQAYFTDYVNYSVASLKFNTFKSRTELGRQYLLHKPIQYEQYEYMDFFSNYFNHYLQQFCNSKAGANLKQVLNTKGDYAYCLEQLAADPILQSDSLRELVLIKGLAECYYLADFNRKTVQAVLEYIAANSKVEVHKTIAANVLRTFSPLQPLADAPVFNLPDRIGKLRNLADYKGKYVYLTFWTGNCTACLQELKLIPVLKRKYGDKIVFVSINVDSDTLQGAKLLSKLPKYDWTFLHLRGGLPNPKAQYEISTLPAYFLIDPNGRLFQSPALSPTESIEATFFELVRRGQRKRGYPPPMPH